MNLFLDSSALAKRYLPEQGSQWIREQLTHATSSIISRLTYVEVMSAVARRNREGRIDDAIVDSINDMLLWHFQKDYLVVEVNEAITHDAVGLIRRYPLRAYDAMQLATAKVVNSRLMFQQLSPITFLCADTRLLQIAIDEGLHVDNPNNYT